MVKALILAGGFGTRLRPLSCTRPKQLFPVGNRPLLEYLLEGLRESGVDTVILATNYMADYLEKYFGESWNGLKIKYSREAIPLGTGGPVKRAEPLLGHDEPFLVLNGDILSNIPYNEMLDAHLDKEATATIALREVEDPSRYGVAIMDNHGRIRKFVEKPKPGTAPSKLINAGAYVLSPKIFAYLPNEERKVSMEREVFPKLADQQKLYGFFYEGLWVDIGKPEDYLRANFEIAKRLAGDGFVFGQGARIDENVEIIPPVLVGDNVEIMRNSCIGPYVVIGNNVRIHEGARLERTVVFPDAVIKSFSSLKGAIIGQGAVVGRWVKIEENTIIGDDAEIFDNVTLVSGCSVCPFKEVSESVLSPSKIM